MASVGFEKQIAVEIGFGGRPACDEGAIFNNDNVSYFGVELPFSFAGRFGSEKHPADVESVEASMCELPFRSESVDFILMRSVYGQFKSRPEIVTPVRMGILECMRVLKPGGKIIIAEENTPRDMDYIKWELKPVGFNIESAEIMTAEWEDLPEDNEYRKLRELYFGSSHAGIYSINGYFGPPNIVVGEKPERLMLVPMNGPYRMHTDYYRVGGKTTRDVLFHVPKDEVI